MLVAALWMHPQQVAILATLALWSHLLFNSPASATAGTDDFVFPGVPYAPYNRTARLSHILGPRSHTRSSNKAGSVVSCGMCCFEKPAPLSQSPFLDMQSPYRADLLEENFYGKVLDVGGIPVAGSKDVADAAIHEAALTLAKLSAKQPHLLTLLLKERVHIAVVGEDEELTDIPAYKPLRSSTSTDWNLFRGLGATKSVLASSCAEENLLCLRNDRYSDENICVHEMAHTLEGSGGKLPMKRMIDFGAEGGGVMNLDDRLRDLFQESVKGGRKLWSNTYAASNHEELWAEGVQSYYSTNYPHAPRGGDGVHNHVWEREELEKYHPELAEVIEQVLLSDVNFSCPPTDADECDCGAMRSICRSAGLPITAPTPEPTSQPTVTPYPTLITLPPTPRPTAPPTSRPTPAFDSPIIVSVAPDLVSRLGGYVLAASSVLLSMLCLL